MPGERLPEFGADGAPAPVGDPPVGTSSPSTDQPAAPQPDASSQSGGAQAAADGSPAEGGVAPAQGSPAAQPPAPPAPPPPVDQGAPAPTAEPPPTTAPAEEPPPAEGEEDLTEEQYAKLLQDIRGEVQEEYEQKHRAQQSGQDRAMAGLQSDLQTSNDRLDTLNREIREGKLQGLSPEEQQKLHRSWELDDREAALNKRLSDMDGYHDDVEIVRLHTAYAEFGVTEEEIEAVPFDERELYCLERRAAYWEQQAKGGQVNGQPAQPAAAVAPTPLARQPAPAGASAPSDTGGGGPATQPPPAANTDKGREAMADNIGQQWEPANFSTTRRG